MPLHGSHAFRESNLYHLHRQRSDVLRSSIGLLTTKKIPAISVLVVIRFGHSWFISRDSLTLWLLLHLLLLAHHLPHHIDQDTLPHVVLPKDLGFCQRFVHRVCNPQCSVPIFSDERVDVLRHLLTGNSIVGEVLPVALEHSHDFLGTFGASWVPAPRRRLLLLFPPNESAIGHARDIRDGTLHRSIVAATPLVAFSNWAIIASASWIFVFISPFSFSSAVTFSTGHVMLLVSFSSGVSCCILNPFPRSARHYLQCRFAASNARLITPLPFSCGVGVLSNEPRLHASPFKSFDSSSSFRVTPFLKMTITVRPFSSQKEPSLHAVVSESGPAFSCSRFHQP